MERADYLVAGGFVLFFVTLFGGLFGTGAYENYLIAKAADPVATACALGKQQACAALAGRSN